VPDFVECILLWLVEANDPLLVDWHINLFTVSFILLQHWEDADYLLLIKERLPKYTARQQSWYAEIELLLCWMMVSLEHAAFWISPLVGVEEDVCANDVHNGVQFLRKDLAEVPIIFDRSIELLRRRDHLSELCHHAVSGVGILFEHKLLPSLVKHELLEVEGLLAQLLSTFCQNECLFLSYNLFQRKARIKSPYFHGLSLAKMNAFVQDFHYQANSSF